MRTSIENIVDVCRLCAKHHERMISINVIEGIEHNLVSIIKKLMPFINFNTNSCLPKQVCFNCASTIIAFNDLWNISIKTNEEFNSLIFDVENKLNHSQDIYEDKTELLSIIEPVSNIKRSKINLDSNQNQILLDISMQPSFRVEIKDGISRDNRREGAIQQSIDHTYSLPPVPYTHRGIDHTYATCHREGIVLNLIEEEKQPAPDLPKNLLNKHSRHKSIYIQHNDTWQSAKNDHCVVVSSELHPNQNNHLTNISMDTHRTL